MVGKNTDPMWNFTSHRRVQSLWQDKVVVMTDKAEFGATMEVGFGDFELKTTPNGRVLLFLANQGIDNSAIVWHRHFFNHGGPLFLPVGIKRFF